MFSIYTTLSSLSIAVRKRERATSRIQGTGFNSARLKIVRTIQEHVSHPTAVHSCQPFRNGRDSPGMLGLVPVMLVMSRIYTHLALPSAGFHSLMAAPRISRVLSSLVFFDTHKTTTKTVLRHFLTEKSQNYYNFGSSV